MKVFQLELKLSNHSHLIIIAQIIPYIL